MGTNKWLPVTEAAAALGVSERTVWRRVKRGDLEIDRGQTPHLIKVLTDSDSDVGTPTTDKVAELTDRVAELETEAQELRAKADRLQYALDRAEGEVDYLRQALAASMGNQQRLLEATTESEGPPGWLERFLPWLGGPE